MASWGDFETAAPDLAAVIRGRFDGHLHHVLGTLTRSGSPRLSGTEARFHDGDLWLGCMPTSLKGKDLVRDPRFALHSAPIDVEMVDGDAKVSGMVTVVNDPKRIAEWLFAIGHGPDPAEPPTAGVDQSEPVSEQERGVGEVLAFVCDIESATLTKVAVDHLAISTWTPNAGLVEREAR